MPGNNPHKAHNKCQLIHVSFIYLGYLTSRPRSTEVLLDTGTPGTRRETYSEDANDGTQTLNPLVINRVLSRLS